MPDPSPRHSAAPVRSTPAITVAVLGASGFVGTALTQHLRDRGVEVRGLTAPRLRWPPGRGYDRYALDVPHPGSGADPVAPATVERLATQIAGTDVVVNAAGAPDGTSAASPALYGANALLPVVVARACAQAGTHRFVHLSSAAVQGGAPEQPLDESTTTYPFSPYSHSKALGEALLLAESSPVERVLFRATWVHAPGRANTTALVRLARSRASCVAGEGTAPTPQVLISDIATSLGYLVTTREQVPALVLQPHNGMTTGLLLRLLGGRPPRRVPEPVARAAVRGLRQYGRLGSRANAHARRAEMLLFGRDQRRGWLASRGIEPPLLPQRWQQLAGVEEPAPDRLRERV